MKNHISATILGLLLLTGSTQAQQKQAPNIILFLVDDMGWMDNSVPFSGAKLTLNQRYHTPNMERLAAQGVLFSNAYATPVCTPSRISLITGMNAAHHGVTNWTSPSKNNSTDAADSTFSPAPWNINGLSPRQGDSATVYATPYPQLLKDAGYYTIHVGKAHWGPMGMPGANPLNLGFQVNIAGHAAGHPQSYLSEEHYGNLPGKNSAQSVPDLEEYYDSGDFLTEALTKEAIKAMANPIARKQPFYLNMAHYAVHTPITADPRYYQQYRDAGLNAAEAKYASLIEGMDKSLGDIMDYLERQHVANNTIIIFMSDNGGLSLNPPRGGAAHSQNLPLKAGKGSVHEGGIREPMLVKWPSVARPGAVCNQPLIIEDFFPSILEMAGVKKYTTAQQVDGKSFVPMLRNPSQVQSERTLVWHYPDKWIAKDGPGINYRSAIRRGNWKMIYNMRTGEKELYDLATDIGEVNNLAQKQPEKVKELSQLLSSQLRQWKSPMPVITATGKPVSMPDEAR
ncbi:Arylsulfatase A [Chitinophaga jiangningensis]|uniref:Arylsulfatase A n=1 Tax=Chitinophaga jiangningensis TaxID=1419482 RepID=A0A1M7JWD7_9BACT|nr:sulfatase [Chitinophaga jiangningensis]SHM57346.1 Arylsulfatase A [Chitinophaga jiangningensis]